MPDPAALALIDAIALVAFLGLAALGLGAIGAVLAVEWLRW